MFQRLEAKESKIRKMSVGLQEKEAKKIILDVEHASFLINI